jgi:hypothetical protein
VGQLYGFGKLDNKERIKGIEKEMIDVTSMENKSTALKSLKFVEQKWMKLYAFLIFTSLFTLVVSFFGVFDLGKATYRYMKAYAFTAQFGLLANQFWYKNAMRYNSKDVTLILNRFKTHYVLRFKDLKSVTIEDKEMIIDNKANGKQSIDLSTIIEEDRLQLLRFLEHRIIMKD